MKNLHQDRDRIKVDESRLIFEPTVNAIGCTQFIEHGLNDWIVANDYESVADSPDTPLGKLVRNLNTPDELASLTEFAGRFCYRSWEKGRGHADYIDNILASRHGSVLEHVSINFTIQGVSRSLSHELVRHSIGTAISQESQRYVDARDMKFVVPAALRDAVRDDQLVRGQFLIDCEDWVNTYVARQDLLRAILEDQGVTGHALTKKINEAAREWLPNASETRMVYTTNLRALRHILEQRGSVHADEQIQKLAVCMLIAARPYVGELLADVTLEDGTISFNHSKV